MNNLTAFQRDALLVIAGQDEPHGLRIKQELDDYYEEQINHGRLYPNLDTLVERDLIDKGSKDRRTNFYELTDLGEEAVQNRQEFVDEQVEEVNRTQI